MSKEYDYLIKNNELNISENEWLDLNQKHTKDEIKEILSDLIDIYNLNLPYRKISFNDVLEDFKKLKKIDAKTLLINKPFFSRYEYKYPFSDLYIKDCKTGNISSDFFHQTNRWLCDSINSPSPFRSWTIKKFRMSLFNALWTLKFKKITNKELRIAIALRKYIASQFKPSAAKCLYQYFNAKNVLDFSMGWGDRLSAFLATDSTDYYCGIDPNYNLFNGFFQQVNHFNINKKIDLFNMPAEHHLFKQNSVDFVCTSPPYFIIERYTQDLNQSWKKYKKLNNWLNFFLFEVIKKAWSALKPNGHMAINISDVYCNHTINRICDPMNDYISTLNDAKYNGCIGLQLAKRPNSKSDKIGVHCEPIWIWKKNQ